MKCVILIPLYKFNLDDYEILSLNQLIKVCGNKYDIITVTYNEFDLAEFNKKYNINIKCKIVYDKTFFENVTGYNIIMLKSDLYKILYNNGYDYTFLYQLDGFIFYDDIEYYMNIGYNYIGSLDCINFETDVFFINGGVSLRNNKYFADVIDKKIYNEKKTHIITTYPEFINYINSNDVFYDNDIYLNEDYFYSIIMPKDSYNINHVLSFGLNYGTIFMGNDINKYINKVKKTTSKHIMVMHGINKNNNMLKYCENYIK